MEFVSCVAERADTRPCASGLLRGPLCTNRSTGATGSFVRSIGNGWDPFDVRPFAQRSHPAIRGKQGWTLHAHTQAKNCHALNSRALHSSIGSSPDGSEGMPPLPNLVSVGTLDVYIHCLQSRAKHQEVYTISAVVVQSGGSRAIAPR